MLNTTSKLKMDPNIRFSGFRFHIISRNVGICIQSILVFSVENHFLWPNCNSPQLFETEHLFLKKLVCNLPAALEVLQHTFQPLPHQCPMWGWSYSSTSRYKKDQLLHDFFQVFFLKVAFLEGTFKHSNFTNKYKSEAEVDVYSQCMWKATSKLGTHSQILDFITTSLPKTTLNNLNSTSLWANERPSLWESGPTVG